MRNISLYFQVHQPFRLGNYRFFDIGTHSNYYDEIQNTYLIRKIAEDCYLPSNKILLDVIKQFGKNIKVTFSISGTAIEQFEEYAPEVLVSFKALADTGCVEFLAETYSHSLVSLGQADVFKLEVKRHAKKIQSLFGQKPKVFRNTELIYNNQIGQWVAEMGFDAIITEGAKHILGWKSPNQIYYNVLRPDLKLILRNYTLSDDIAFRFSDYDWDEHPLTAEKYVNWIKNLEDKEAEIVNLFMDYETFGEHQSKESGIFEFLKAFLTNVAQDKELRFVTPTWVAKNLQPIAPMNVEHTISWADEERDVTAWLGNDMQADAFKTLNKIALKMNVLNDPELIKDWKRIQTSDHFYYMSTKQVSDGTIHEYFNPYRSPYDAFINYMNVLNDFNIRAKKAYKAIISNDKNEIQALIKEYKAKIKLLEDKLAIPAIIEKTKPVRKAISKSKPKIKEISKSKKQPKAAISKTKKQPKAIGKHKKD